MLSNSCPEDRKNSGDSVLSTIPAGTEESSLICAFINNNDFSAQTRRAFSNDLRKFAHWFIETNKEHFVIGRVTTRDVSDFRDHLRREKNQAVSSVNRALV